MFITKAIRYIVNHPLERRSPCIFQGISADILKCQWYRYLCIAILLINFSGQSLAQQGFQLIAKTNVKNVVIDQVFEVSFQVGVNNYADFKAPKFDGFKVVGGPNRSTQTTIVNGQISSNVSMGYSLLAQKLGSHTIPPAQIKINNQWIKSNTLKINVVNKKKPTTNTDLDEQDIFLQIELSTDTAFVGQQIIVDYVLYSNVRTRGASVISAPDFSDFYVQSPRLFPRTAQRITINDEVFESSIIQRLCLFPQFPGEFNLDAVVANVRILLEGGSNSPFSFFQPTKSVNVRSDKSNIVARSIPAEEPKGFIGGVGAFTIIPSVNRTKVKQNQAVKLRLRMRGNGDPKKLKAPDLIFPAHVTTYDPKLITDELTESQGEIIGLRTYEYVIVPSEIGDLKMAFDLYYFSPDSADFVMADKVGLNVEVVEGEVIEEGESILYDQTIAEDDPTKNTFWKWGIPLVALASLFGLGWMMRSKKKSDHIIVEEINWEERARQYLATAQERINDSKGSDFYEAIRNGIYGYVAQKLNLPISELTQEKAMTKLRAEGVDESLILEIEGIIKKSEMALFAGLNKETDRRLMYDQAVRLLGSLEKVFSFK